jgi:hypothetical protein
MRNFWNLGKAPLLGLRMPALIRQKVASNLGRVARTRGFFSSSSWSRAELAQTEVAR